MQTCSRMLNSAGIATATKNHHKCLDRSCVAAQVRVPSLLPKPLHHSPLHVII
jgi:hypothetical protein